MNRPFLRLTAFAFLLGLLLPAVTVVNSHLFYGARFIDAKVLLQTGLLAGAGLLAFAVILFALWRANGILDQWSVEQAEFLDRLSGRTTDWAIVMASGLSLFLELAMIRWQTTVFEFFAHYKNFGLLACFAGLGLGYALSNRRRIPLALCIPLLTFQMALLLILRNGLPAWLQKSLLVTPVVEQLNLGLAVARSASQFFAVYFFLSFVYLITALAFIPVGQLCGCLMERRPMLRAYGLNLLGSIVGTLLLLVVSYLWTPPPVWFAISFAVLLLFFSYDKRTLLTGVLFALAALVMLCWPFDILKDKIYSPYQVITRGQNDLGYMEIGAAGLYYQRVYDLSPGNPNRDANANLRAAAAHYDLPYRLHPHPQRVAIVGAGTGNDTAAALRAKCAQVDAIEIDPVILKLGKAYHPEKPYDDPRVKSYVNDARTFLRNTTRNYDMIVYGLLDSHALLSHASSVRLDSFVHTVEAYREARQRLRPGGVLVLSFSTMSEALGRKFYLMLSEAFDGRPPLCLYSGYDGAVVFIQSYEGGFAADPARIKELNFENRTGIYANPAIQTDVSTDDWPFLYMPRRVYPVSYLGMVALVFMLTVVLVGGFLAQHPRISHAAFFFLGAGFMLVETKAITEIGLTFGNTWHVIGIVIVGILSMALFANCLVSWLNVRRPGLPLVLLLASLGLGYIVARMGGFPSTTLGRLTTLAVLTCPMLFSGLVFSTMLRGCKNISSAMAMNLTGAIVGGLLEYNSMYFGFRFLYVLAIGLYLGALVSFLLSPRSTVAPDAG